MIGICEVETRGRIMTINPVAEWVDEILQEFGELFTDLAKTCELRGRPRFDEKGHWKRTPTPIFNFNAVWHEKMEEIYSLPTAGPAARHLLDQEKVELNNDAPYKSFSEASEGYKRTILMVAIGLVRQYLEEGHSTDSLDKESFTSIYEQHIEHWKSDTVTHRMTMPILGFLCAEEFAVDEKITVVELTSEDKTDLAWELMEARTLSDLGAAEFCATASYERDKRGSSNANKNLRRKFDAFVAALRFFGGGRVATAGIFRTAPDVPDSFSQGASRSPHSNFRLPVDVGQSMGFPTSTRERLLLTADKIDDFRELYQLVEKVYSRKPQFRKLEMPFKRFHQTYRRSTAEDKIIDLTIALEGTVLSDIRHELSYRLALRGAALVKKEHDPGDTYETLRALYEARSQIVHVGKRLREIANTNDEIKGVPRDELISRAKNVTRKIFIEYLKRLKKKKSLTEINRVLDEGFVEAMADLT